jgi:hypothetical protein
MLEQVGQKLMRKDEEDIKAIVLRLWRPVAIKDHLTRDLENLELRRQKETQELQEKLEVEYEKVKDLEGKKEALETKMMAAGCEPLRRALAAYNGKAMLQWTMKAWKQIHPVLIFANELEFCQGELAECQTNLAAAEEKSESLIVERDEAQEKLPPLEAKAKDLEDQLEYIKRESGVSVEAVEARLRAEKEKEALWVQKLADKDAEFKAAREEWSDEKDDLDLQIKVLEGRLVVAEMDGGGGGGQGEVDEATRIVPKGQGVLCVGCLKQLLHRAVRPLSCAAAMSDDLSIDQAAQAKQKFFTDELKGAPNPDDPLHTAAWKTTKDPYGISRLTVMPQSALLKKPPKGFRVEAAAASPLKDFGSMSSPNLSTSTGLPALKKSTRMRAMDGAASPMKMSMKEFRPRNFR